MYNLDLALEINQSPEFWEIKESTVDRFLRMQRCLFDRGIHFEFFIAQYESDTWLSAINSEYNFTIPVLEYTVRNESVYVSTYDGAVNALIDKVLSVVE